MEKIETIMGKPFDFKSHENLFNIAIVVSRFNENITSALLDSALARLQKLAFPMERVTLVKVPGAVEIGLATQQLLALPDRCYAVIICLGAVIRGETDHYHYVCQQVSYACQKLALEKSIPIIFSVLTTNNESQASERSDKGSEAVDAAMEMVSVLDQIKRLS